MATCAHHPDREAVFNCIGCGKDLCESCAQGADDLGYCRECLALANENAETQGKFTPSLAVGLVTAIAVGLLLLHANITAVTNFLIAASRLFVRTEALDAYAAVFTVLLAVAYLALALGMAATKRWAIALGFFLNILTIVLDALGAISLGHNAEGPVEYLIITAMLVLLTVCLVLNQKKLKG